jgi:hypothetical protein
MEMTQGFQLRKNMFPSWVESANEQETDFPLQNFAIGCLSLYRCLVPAFANTPHQPLRIIHYASIKGAAIYAATGDPEPVTTFFVSVGEVVGWDGGGDEM